MDIRFESGSIEELGKAFVDAEGNVYDYIELRDEAGKYSKIVNVGVRNDCDRAMTLGRDVTIAYSYAEGIPGGRFRQHRTGAMVFAVHSKKDDRVFEDMNLYEADRKTLSNVLLMQTVIAWGVGLAIAGLWLIPGRANTEYLGLALLAMIVPLLLYIFLVRPVQRLLALVPTRSDMQAAVEVLRSHVSTSGGESAAAALKKLISIGKDNAKEPGPAIQFESSNVNRRLAPGLWIIGLIMTAAIVGGVVFSVSSTKVRPTVAKVDSTQADAVKSENGTKQSTTIPGRQPVLAASAGDMNGFALIDRGRHFELVGRAPPREEIKAVSHNYQLGAMSLAAIYTLFPKGEAPFPELVLRMIDRGFISERFGMGGSDMTSLLRQLSMPSTLESFSPDQVVRAVQKRRAVFAESVDGHFIRITAAGRSADGGVKFMTYDAGQTRDEMTYEDLAKRIKGFVIVTVSPTKS
jgi:hypothetical protein